MAARKRTGAENGVAEQPRVLESSKEEILRRERRVKRDRAPPNGPCYSCIRWSIVVAVLLLLALGLVYYFTRIYHRPEGELGVGRGGGGGGGERQAGGGGEKKNGAPTGKSKKQTKVGDKGDKRGPKSTGKKSTTEKKEKSKSKGKRRGGVHTVAMEDVRLLRRPVGIDDADRPYIIEILNGDNLLLEKRYSEALEKFNEVLKMFPQSPRGLFGKGETLTGLAAQKSSNKLLETAIEFYEDTANSFLANEDLKVAALARLADLCQERGKHAAAVSALEKLYNFDNNDTVVANRLGTAYVRTGKYQKAESHFKKLLRNAPDNTYAKAHLGYLLFRDREFEKALPLLMEGLRHDASIQRNPRFYLYAGEALSRLNRSDEAQVLYSEAVSHDLFPSLYQRSIFNQPDLTAKPWWDLQETGYLPLLTPLFDNLPNISSEVIPALLGGAQTPPRVFPLYSQGKRNAENCRKVPFTCSLVEKIPEATSCRHGETKFLVVPPNSHVPPHTGQTNTRLVVVMGLNLGEGQLEIRLGEEKRVLKEGGVLVFDDSFQQEVWFHSPRPGLVLSMDVWHPDLPTETRKKLHPIH